MFGLFSLFGRSREMQRLDLDLRERGVHPRLVPDAVKIALLKLGRGDGVSETRAGHDRAAALIAYCMLGARDFEDVNGPAQQEEAERRLDAAIAAGDSADAQLVLLALHVGLVHPEVGTAFGLEVGDSVGD